MSACHHHDDHLVAKIVVINVHELFSGIFETNFEGLVLVISQPIYVVAMH